jgi:DNA-binding YbaB/EbfC family protein
MTGAGPRRGLVSDLRRRVRAGYIHLFRTGRLRSMTNFQQILQMGQQVQARLSQLQTELGQRTVTTTSGGGMVTVTADGRGKIRSIKIDPSVVDPQDIEMLEDLVLAAVSDAQSRATALYEEEMKKLSGGFNLPFQFPGM